MQLLVYVLINPLIWILSILPLKVLYVFSDFLYLLIYHVIGYRKKVVRHNLKLAFPEKSEKERRAIEKKSIHHFIDSFMEMIRSFQISKEEIAQRISIEDPEIMNDFIKKNKSVIVLSSHYGNWEWAPYLVNQTLNCEVYGAYTKIQNKYIDNKMKKSRGKFGAKFIATKEFIYHMQKNHDDKKVVLYGFLSDQSPQLKKTHYWRNFFDNRVPVITGHEMLAKRFDYPIVYLRTDRIKRGYYRSKFTVLAENPKEFPDYQITDHYIELLQNQIRENPAFYFWTHKRFKHMGKEDRKEK